jgi:hypothetical protein
MAIRGAIRVEFEDVFPHGAWLVSEVTPVKDYDRSTEQVDQQVVERDEQGEPVLVDGQPLRHWQVTVMDGDPQVKQRDKTLTVTVIAAHQPVPPEAVANTPFVPVELTGMTFRTWLNRQGCRPPRGGRQHICGAREVVSLTATGLRAPAKATAPAVAGNGRGGSG